MGRLVGWPAIDRAPRESRGQAVPTSEGSVCEVRNRESRADGEPQHPFSFLLARILDSTFVCANFETVELFRLTDFSIYSICGGF